VMDMQSAILSRFAETSVLLGNTKKAIASAREKKIPVIYVVVGFRPGAPEISSNNKGFSANRAVMTSVSMEEMIKVHPDLAPFPGEITVVKRRISAFTGSDLEVVLRAFSIQHMILTGVSTSGVVLSTLREAADKDYRLTVLSDCCADGDEEVHRVLTNKIFPRQADVITVEEWNERREKFS
ncbi:MAG TPA: cysteine hydrolase, partial [Puia sp.]|nr:cysteine hydrolase [Puia sp.]